ncbi:hypothetical protein BH09SUM1_BH09SUM1_24910 [soil metagenome]
MKRITLSARHAFCAALAAFAIPASAEWTSVHRDASNNALNPITATVTNVAVAPTVTTGPKSIVTGCAPIIFGAQFVSVSRPTGPDSVYLQAYSKTTGSIVWTTPNLDATTGTFSLSVPTVDTTENRLYFPTGVTVYKINPTTPTTTTVWSTSLSATNTDATAGAVYSFTNAVPAIGAGKVFVQTYDDTFTPPFTRSQLVALDATLGGVSWFKRTGGLGTVSPLFFDNGGSPIVITAIEDSTGAGGMKAFSASNGNLVWSSETVSVPWSTTNLVYTDMVLSAGKIYAVTYNFSGTNGQLIRIDAATGAQDYKVSSITSDCPPVIAGGTLYLLGGPFGSSKLESHAASSGLFGFQQNVAGSIFRNYLAATNDRLYVAISGAGSLRILNPADGTVLSAATGTDYDGPVSIDDNGDIYANGFTGRTDSFHSVAGVIDWAQFNN